MYFSFPELMIDKEDFLNKMKIVHIITVPAREILFGKTVMGKS